MKRVKILFTCSGICLFFSLLFSFIMILSPKELGIFEVTESNTTEYTGTVRSITSDREGYKIQVEEHDIALFVPSNLGQRELFQSLQSGEQIFYRLSEDTTFEWLEEVEADQIGIAALKTNDEVFFSLEDHNDFLRDQSMQLDHLVFVICLILFLVSVFLFVRGFVVRKREKGGEAKP